MKEEVASVFGVIRGLTALFAVLATALPSRRAAASDTPDTDGGLSAAELAAKLPDGGTPQAVAVDVDAAKEAAGLAEATDPTEISTSREELRFGLSTFSALLSLAALTDNPVRAAIDHSQLSAYAAHPYVSDDAVTLVSTSQDFDEIASSLEDAGWERDGDVLTTDGDPAGGHLHGGRRGGWLHRPRLQPGGRRGCRLGRRRAVRRPASSPASRTSMRR